MNAVLFDYPKKAYFGKTIPKSKFYEFGNVSSKLKDLFVKQVEQITWLYKLAPETINVQATKDVPEIQVFEIELKGDCLSEEILLCIDKAVHYPIIFEIKSQVGIKTVCALKTKTAGEWKINEYVESIVVPENHKRIKLDIGLSLNSIYEQIILSLCSTEIRRGESLEDLMERMLQIKIKLKLLEGLRIKINTEKQFNKKIEFNSRIRTVTDELNQLMSKRNI